MSVLSSISGAKGFPTEDIQGVSLQCPVFNRGIVNMVPTSPVSPSRRGVWQGAAQECRAMHDRRIVTAPAAGEAGCTTPDTLYLALNSRLGHRSRRIPFSSWAIVVRRPPGSDYRRLSTFFKRSPDPLRERVWLLAVQINYMFICRNMDMTNNAHSIHVSWEFLNNYHALKMKQYIFLSRSLLKRNLIWLLSTSALIAK